MRRFASDAVARQLKGLTVARVQTSPGEDRWAIASWLPKTVGAAFFISPVSRDSETRIGTAAAPGVDRSCHPSPARILGQAPGTSHRHPFSSGLPKTAAPLHERRRGCSAGAQSGHADAGIRNGKLDPVASVCHRRNCFRISPRPIPWPRAAMEALGSAWLSRGSSRAWWAATWPWRASRVKVRCSQWAYRAAQSRVDGYDLNFSRAWSRAGEL